MQKVINKYIISIGCLAVTSLCVGLSAAEQAPVSNETIRRAWTERQNAAQTFVIEYICEATIYKDSARKAARAANIKSLADEHGENPPRDFLVKGTGRVAVSGNKIRYEKKIAAWNPEKKVLEDTQFIETFNGSVQKQYDSTGHSDLSNSSFPVGWVMNAKRSTSAPLIQLAPLIWTYRGIALKNDIDDFSATGRVLLISGTECIELVRKSQDGSINAIRYLDHKKDYLLVRQSWLGPDGKPTWQIEATYKADPKLGWVIGGWEYFTGTGGGNIEDSGRYTVSAYTFGQEIKDEEFDYSFPPKTRVYDRTKGKETIEYVIQDDARPGVEILSVQSPTYKELNVAQLNTRRQALWIALLAIVATTLGFAFYKRLRKRAPHEGSQI
jgi:hypothetical protein